MIEPAEPHCGFRLVAETSRHAIFMPPAEASGMLINSVFDTIIFPRLDAMLELGFELVACDLGSGLLTHSRVIFRKVQVPTNQLEIVQTA